ncbi:hypothetical protein LJR129_002494 [Acidovorax sp. LjRoot129]|uniref:hypothetical protein n=1 Tax=Acidovorax sp. LjRoot129 TaxID=3342260 RepID=UPI003ECC23C6
MHFKKTAIALAIAVLLSGCGGLHVSWVATASYNATAITQMESTHSGEEKRK